MVAGILISFSQATTTKEEKNKYFDCKIFVINFNRFVQRKQIMKRNS